LHTSVQCAQCHSTVAGGYNLPAPAGCGDQNCHATDYNGTNNPFHVAIGAALGGAFQLTPATNCANCHSTAAAYTTTSWSHTATGWALSGNHQMAPAGAATNCNQCHVGNNYGLTLGNPVCWGCHQTDYNSTANMGGGIPNHVSAGFPQACDTCHDQISWANSTFNHNNTGFPLTGMHASAAQCSQCHVNGNYVTDLPGCAGDSKYSCHATDYSTTNNPVHSSAGNTFLAANCANCHSTAAAYTTTSWSHTSTGWALTGNHQMTPAGAATNCNQCHTGNNYGLNNPDCYTSNCHTTDWTSTTSLGGAVPNHVAMQYPSQLCTTCHDTILWADGTFNHATTGWALTGYHLTTACALCHTTANGAYGLTSANTACYPCHTADWNSTATLGGSVPNHQTAGYPTTCDSCHTTTAWTGATFNHTWFPIPHHSSVCADCHQVSTDYTQFTCINCHTNTSAHRPGMSHPNVCNPSPSCWYGATTCYNCHKNGGG